VKTGWAGAQPDPQPGP